MTKQTIFLALTAILAIGCADIDGSVEHSEGDLSARASFDVFRGQGGSFYFNFSAANHQVILSSEGYQNRVGAIAGVLSVLENASDESAFEVNNAANGGAYFNLLAANGAVIATSEIYSTRSNANRGVRAVIDNIGNYLAAAASRSGARFVVFENESGDFFFQLRAANGKVVLRSEAYSSEAAALNGAFSVSEYGVSLESFDVRGAANGGFYFNLVAANGQTIGTSQVYSTKSNATRACNSIINLLPTIDIL